QMGYGGSSTPMSMFFVTLVGFFFGPAIGIVSGVAYGFLQLVQRASIIHPMQLLLDYPMAFGMLGLSGFFWKIKGGLYIGFVVAVIGRWLIHTIAGWLYWIGFATPGSLWASIVYNSTYIIPEMVLTLVIIAIPPVRNALNHVKRRIAEDGL
ncbi:MAG: energy-coupled thiamine transporter ThiT, partial [Defluviitaleaceae bacterium]|nr:energy-coupled thiamine transporter ThiT [Defluviitaleaceae bacterium]